MYEEFRSAFSQSGQVENIADASLLAKVEPYAAGFTQLMSEHGGASFGNGIYRLHTVQDIKKWTQIVEAALTDFKDRTVCFGYDWLGRHFALDKARVEDGDQMLVLLLEPGTGEAMEIPFSFKNFHNEGLFEYHNAALASDFYEEWLESGGEPPVHSDCVGYKVPLFLNGEDTIDNLEVSDMDVYWSVCSQLLNGEGD